VGEEYEIWVNQGWRDAVVMACIGPEAIIEYVMPSGRSALRKIPRNVRFDSRFGHDLPTLPYKNVSYRQIPKVWLLAIAKSGLPWYASPQGVPDLHMTPRELFLSKWPEDAWLLQVDK